MGIKVFRRLIFLTLSLIALKVGKDIIK